MKTQFALLALLLAGCLVFAAGEEKPEEAVESDEELEARLSEADLSDPNKEEEENLVPKNWTPESKLDSANKLFHGRYYINIYDQINNELVSKVHSMDREPNMAFAQQWLANLTSTGKVSIFKYHIVEALKQFTALNTTLNNCDRDSYAILYKNNKATRGRSHVAPSKSKELRRIERLVYLHSMEHAIYCLPRYSSIFKSILAKRDFKEVMLFQEATILQHRHKMAKGLEIYNHLNLLLKMDQKQICKNNADAAIEVISELTADNQSDQVWLHKVLDEKKGKLVVDEEKVQYLMQKYLVKPCKFFIRELGSNVIQPARYDVKMLEPSDFDDGPEGMYDIEFRLGQARYRFCKILVRHQNSLVNSMVKKIGSSN